MSENAEIVLELQLEQVRHALVEARRKLRSYHAQYGIGPVSGMEYEALMRLIDEALK